MPARRRFAFLPLFATLAAFLLSSSSAWAQNVSFPFFGGGDSNAITSMLTAFTYQWRFFGAVAGTAGGSANALYYMAITATLVGAILIIINKKYQNPVTIGTWFILVLVMVFAPYNSQLLFYPLNTVQNANLSAAGGGTPVASNGGACSPGNGNSICGFTPQVVAAHLGSTLALLVYDVFQKDGMQGLADQVNSQTALNNDANLKAPNIDEAYNNYLRVCDSSKTNPKPLPLPASMNTQAGSGSGSSGAASNPVTVPFSQAYQGIRSNVLSSDSSAPNAIAIPKYASPADAGGQWANYTNGVEALRAAYLGSTSRLTNNADYPAAVDAIIQAINDKSQAQVQDSTFYSANPMLKMSSYITTAPAGGGALPSSDATVAAREQFFITGRDKPYAQKLGLTPENKTDAGVATYLNTLANDPAIKQMPVIPVTYDIKRDKCDGMAGGSSCTGTVTPTVGADTTSCIGAADAAFKAAILGLGATNNSDYHPLLNLLTDTSNPNIPMPLQASQVCTYLGSSQGGVTGCPSADSIVKYVNSHGDSANKSMLASLLANTVIRNSLHGSAPGQADAVPTGTKDPTGNSAAARGFQGVKDAVSTVAGYGGMAVASGIGYFVNIIGNAILAVVKVLAQLALMGIIIMTPFIFLMGLLVPTNAAGMLIVTTMAVFILKFYPATIAILNFTVNTINAAQWAGSGTLMGITLEGLLMMVQGLLAAKILSLTFWIMFKMGDVNNLRAITSLESSASQIANIGFKVLELAAGAAMAVATGGVSATIPKTIPKLPGGGKGGDDTPKQPETPEVKGQLGEVITDNRSSDEISADGWQKSAEDALKKDADAKASFDRMMPEIQPGGEDDLLHAGWMSTIPMDKAEEAGSPAGEAEKAASADDKGEEAAGTEKSPSIVEGLEEAADGSLQAGGQVYEDGNWRKNASGQYEVRRKGSGVGFTGRDTWVPLDKAVAEDSKFQSGGISTQARGVPLGGGAGGNANVNGEFGGALAAGDVNLQNAQATATAGGGSDNGQSVGSASSTTDGAPTVATAGGGAGGTPPGAPTSEGAPAGGGERDLRVGRMEVAQANMPANIQQQAAIAPNSDDAEWLSKSRGERFLRGAWSGLIGTVASSGQLANIPGIGQVMRMVGEIANEGTEAPIRARAFWKAGKERGNQGFSGLSYWKAMKDQSALRMYQQREGVMAGAAAYNTLKDNGHLMSGWDNASNAAIQVAARQMADHVGRAMVQQQKGQLTAHDYFNVNMLSSMQNPLSIKRMNFAIQEGIFDYDEYSRTRVPNKSGGFTDTGFKYEGTVRGFDAVLHHQDMAALEQAASTPLQMKEATSVHARKMWDRVEDVQRVKAKLASGKMGARTGANADGDWAFVAADGKTVVNPEQAFFVDEHHLFKPEFEVTGKTVIKGTNGGPDREVDVWTPKRNHRQKAQRFIREKILDSKVRDQQVNADGDALFWQEYEHKLTDMKGASSPAALRIAHKEYERQLARKKWRATPAGEIAARVREINEVVTPIIDLGYAKGNDFQNTMSIMVDGRKEMVDNAYRAFVEEMAGEEYKIELPKVLDTVSKLAYYGGPDLVKSIKSSTKHLNVQGIKRGDLQKILKEHRNEFDEEARKAVERIAESWDAKPKYKGDNPEYIPARRAPREMAPRTPSPVKKEEEEAGNADT